MKKLSILLMAAILLSTLCGLMTVSASIPAGGGKGEALAFSALKKATPSSNVTISEEQDDTFGKVYQYAYDGLLTNTNLQFLLTFKGTEKAEAGSYYYFSFYIRFIDDDTYDLPNSFVRRPNVNNNSGQSGLGTPPSEWKKLSFVTTNTSEIAENAEIQMRLIPFMTAGTKVCVQIAEPGCVYYGKVTADGELSPEQVIEATLGKSEIQTIYIDGEAVSTEEFPDEYFAEILWETTDLPEITADTYIKGMYDVTCDSDTLPAQYTVTSYALNYDKLTQTGGKTEYKVNVDYKKAWAQIDVSSAPKPYDYTVAAGDIIDVTYELYNYDESTAPCKVVLLFKDGNMFKEVITWDTAASNDIVSYTVTDENLVGCSVTAYIISPDNMTIIN